MRRNKHRIGITGGVGSGKSTVLAMLRENWLAEILEADAIARELMEPGGSCYEAVVREFGPGILVPEPDGDPGDWTSTDCVTRRNLSPGGLSAGRAIDRGRLAEIVFADEAGRLRLNALTHPLVKEEAARRMEASEAPLVVYESALPKEACLRELCEEIWYIHVPHEERIRRLMRDRGYSRSRCLAVMDAQLSDAEFRACADRVLENGGTLEETEKQLQSFLTSGILN